MDRLGGREDRASPYAGPSCNLISSIDSHCVSCVRVSSCQECNWWGTHVVVVRASEQSVAISSDDALKVATSDVEQ